MALRKPIHSKRRNALHNIVLRIRPDAVARHPRAQPALQILHALHRSPHAHCPPQLFRLRAAETRHRHRHAQQLFLKQRNSEGPFEHRLQRWVRIADFLLALPPPHVWMHHFAHDGPRSYDRHLHHQVVEAHRRVVRNRRHLRAALHLEHAHRIRLAKRLVDQRILWQRSKVHILAVVTRDQLDRVFNRSHHAQPQQVHFDQPHVRAIFLIPLNHGAPRHRRALNRYHPIEHPRANHHAAGMLPKVTRQILHAQAQIEIAGNARMSDIEARLSKVMRHRVVFPAPLPMPNKARQPRQLIVLKAQRLAHLACRRAPAIRDHVGRHRRTQRAVAFIHILNHLLALIAGRQIEIDVRPLPAILIQKSLKQQFHPHRIHRRDFKCITYSGIRSRSTSLHQNSIALTVENNVPDNQKISGKPKLRD